jgi:hypothetical protein
VARVGVGVAGARVGGIHDERVGLEEERQVGMVPAEPEVVAAPGRLVALADEAELGGRGAGTIRPKGR